MKKNLKKAIAVFLAVLMAFSVMPMAFAEDGETTEINWTDNKGPLKTDGAFKYYEYTRYYIDGKEYACQDDDVFPPLGIAVDDTLNVIEVAGYTYADRVVDIPPQFGNQAHTSWIVNVIGPSVFADSTILDVKLPNTIQIIGDYAFNNCTCIETVEFKLPDNLKYIGDGAFRGCTGIESFHIPETLEYIGREAFYGCTGFVGNSIITNLTIANEDGRFDNQISLVLPKSVKYIGDSAFYGCESIVSALIDCNVEEIYAGTFSGCTGLQRLEFGKNIKGVYNALSGAFSGHSIVDAYEPALIFDNPHCVIEKTEKDENNNRLIDMDSHTIIYGVKYSTAHSLADKGYLSGYGEGERRYSYKFRAISSEAHKYTGKVILPACLVGGYTEYICSCGIEDADPYRDTYTDPTGHNYTKNQTFNADDLLGTPNEKLYCTSGDTYRCVCKNALDPNDPNSEPCGFITYETMNIRGCDIVSKCSATCTGRGATYDECKHCKKVSNYTEIGALGHQWQQYKGSEWIVNNSPVVSVCVRENGCGAYRTAAQVANCKCRCHNHDSGIQSIIYMIQVFLWQLFRISANCECGARHY